MTDIDTELANVTNPFLSASAGNPWEDKPVADVAEIHQPVYLGIKEMIDTVSRDPSAHVAGLVLGEAGSGKTHLIGRLLRQRHQDPLGRWFFSYVHPVEGKRYPYRHLLKEIIGDLSRSDSGFNGRSILDMLVAEMTGAMLKRFFRPGKSIKNNKLIQRIITEPQHYLAILEQLTPTHRKQIQQRTTQYIRKDEASLSADTLNVLFHFCQGEPGLRIAARDWLMGADPEKRYRKKMSVPNRKHYDSEDIESEARTILRSVGYLMGRFGFPLVICFDCLENLDGQGQIDAFARIITLLVDEVSSVVPLAFIRGSHWREYLAEKLDSRVSTRLESNAFSLRGCTRPQAESLIQARLDRELGALWLEKTGQQLENLLEEGAWIRKSPRQVIIQANQRLKNRGSRTSEDIQQEDPIFSVLNQSFNHRFQTVYNSPDLYPPNLEQMQRALMLVLSSQVEEKQLHWMDEGGDRVILIEQDTNQTPIKAFLLSVDDSHQAIRAILTAAHRFLIKHATIPVVFFRDGRQEIPAPPNWPETNRLLETFLDLGGKLVELPWKRAARWYGLALLQFAVEAGDITIRETDGRHRTVSMDELSRFVRKKAKEIQSIDDSD
ncbi:MAG: ATP-binding protein [Magnetococcales bacterium]|nr:ATP-binding protein [Magnetococcales bacterium]